MASVSLDPTVARGSHSTHISGEGALTWMFGCRTYLLPILYLIIIVIKEIILLLLYLNYLEYRLL